MLLVDPLKRITIPEIRQHPWFMLHLPRYLAVMQVRVWDACRCMCGMLAGACVGCLQPRVWDAGACVGCFHIPSMRVKSIHACQFQNVQVGGALWRSRVWLWCGAAKKCVAGRARACALISAEACTWAGKQMVGGLVRSVRG